MEIEFTVHIDPEKRRHECHASLAFAAAGSLTLLFLGLLCPPLWLCLAGAWVPMLYACFARYRNMVRQEQTPDKICIGTESIIYHAKGKKSFSMPLTSIRRVEYRNGIQLFVKGVPKIQIHDPTFILSQFMYRSRKEKCDLFFPWFDNSVKARLQDIVHAD